jgi:CxxC motif-containing protein (DUF1111 family)
MNVMDRSSAALREWRREVSSMKVAVLGMGLLGAWLGGAPRAWSEEPVAPRGAEASDEQVRAGREIFAREWLASDPRSHGGDGLGPVFNDSSCVACHNSGAPGGAGAANKNVDIVTASPMVGPQVMFAPTPPTPPSFLEQTFEALLGVAPSPRTAPVTAAPAAPRPRRPDRSALIARHPGFRTTNSVVVHRDSTMPDYGAWRSEILGIQNFVPQVPMGLDSATKASSEIQNHRMLAQNNIFPGQMQTQIGEFFIQRSQRNPSALFGSGLMDAIPDSVLIEQAKVRSEKFPEIAGRVSEVKGGKIGRFGWKGQTASLDDFVLTACAVELGLEVPGHPQGGLPQKPDEKAKGLDLTADECASLTAYIRNLPKPSELNSTHAEVEAGKTLFGSIGCATCHVPKLGDVEGIYGDLLLHDMGDTLGDTGQYGVFVPDPSEQDFVEEEVPLAQAEAQPGVTVDTTPAQVVTAPTGAVVHEIAQVATATPAGVAFDGPVPSEMMMGGMMAIRMGGVATNRPTKGPASRQEWRTPPLWGLRDSGPYMHDGRAQTLEQAIALHSGEAERITHNYFALTAAERRQVQSFLKSLAAPTGDGVAQLAKAK